MKITYFMKYQAYDFNSIGKKTKKYRYKNNNSRDLTTYG